MKPLNHVPVYSAKFLNVFKFITQATQSCHPWPQRHPRLPTNRRQRTKTLRNSKFDARQEAKPSVGYPIFMSTLCCAVVVGGGDALSPMRICVPAAAEPDLSENDQRRQILFNVSSMPFGLYSLTLKNVRVTERAPGRSFLC